MVVHRHTPAQRRRIAQGLPPGPATPARRTLPSQASPTARKRAFGRQGTAKRKKR